jgi:SWI/SNF-related matrix-associated actin-dependent regulator 1 of chromatin subfamily A
MELTHRLGCYELRGAKERPSAAWKPRGSGIYATAHIDEAAKFFKVADTKTKIRLRPYIERLVADIAASTALDGDISQLRFPVGLLPRPYQAAGVHYALGRRTCLNADAPRLGKTIQSILQANTLASNLGNKRFRWLIICPANAKIQWFREVEKWRTFGGTVKILQGTSDTFDADVVIMNWELVPYYGRELLNDLAFDFTTFDEAHRLRHLKSQTTTICLGKDLEDNSIGADAGGIKARDRLFLTGTPIFTKPVNIWPLVRASDPNSLGRNFYDFGTRYCGAERGKGVKFDPSGASNLDELQIRMRRTFMVRRERRDVAGEIPSSFDSVIFPRETFESVLRKEASELRAQFGSDDRPLSQILADAGDGEIARAASSYEALSLAKLPLCIEHISPQVEAGEKVVVFAHHRSVLFKLRDAFDGCAFFPGGLTMNQRQYQIDRFREDDNCRVMVAGITAAGEAVSFAAANTSVFVEIVYSHGAMEQAEERIVLTDKTDPLSIQFLIVEGSADETFFEIRNTRRDESKRAMDVNRLVLPQL